MRCPIFSVRVADRAHINTCETGKPQLWQSLLDQACVIHFIWLWHRGIYTVQPQCCIAERLNGTPSVGECSFCLGTERSLVLQRVLQMERPSRVKSSQFIYRAHLYITESQCSDLRIRGPRGGTGAFLNQLLLRY